MNPNEVESVTQVGHDTATQSKVEGSQLSVLFIDYFVTYRCVKMSNTDIMDVGNILERTVWVLGCNSLLFLHYLQCIYNWCNVLPLYNRTLVYLTVHLFLAHPLLS